MRPSYMAASKPASTSLPRSGPRFGLPGAEGRAPDTPPGAVIPWNVLIAVRFSGCLPASPNAPRKRKVLTAFQRQNGSSLTTQVALALGYVTKPNDLPNALLSSPRRAAVR